MNKQVHRLVFDRRRGMRVPAAEHVRSAGKAAGGASRAKPMVASGVLATAAMAGSLAWGLLPGEALAQQRTMGGTVMRSATALSNMASTVNRNLPQAYSGSLHANEGKFNTATVGQTLNINQFDDKVIINWDSFNVGSGYTVRFIQPNSSSSALNNIWSLDPSVILGQIQANGEVILQNQNGFIFGQTARVDTSRFVTTALKLARDTYMRGIRARTTDGAAAFGDDESAPTGFITIERGAEIKALAGGEVMMVAPKVYNEGTIETPKGQTILAAGQKVYLYNTTDSAQRGLVVAVDAFADSSHDVNTVEQAAAVKYKTVNGEAVSNSNSNSNSTSADTAGLATKINQIVAEQGTINLVGMTIRQNGTLTATTAIKGQNGAIYLQAQKNTFKPTGSTHVANELGTVDFGRDSVTEVKPSAETVFNPITKQDEKPTQKDAEVFYRSSISVMGKDIRVRSGAKITAVSGNISVLAAADTQNASIFNKENASGPSDGSRLVVESGATISAAGLRQVAVPMSRNQLSSRLFATELADSPVQRGGVLYRADLLSDARRQVSVGNVTGQYNLIGRNVDELSTRGGNVRLWSQGDLVIADDATIDISGGSIQYQAGQVMSSLVRRGNQLLSVENAKAGEKYDALITPTSELGAQQVASYEQGADAGTAWVAGANTYLGTQVLKADVVLGPLQRAGQASGGQVSVGGGPLDPLGADLPVELGVALILKTRPDLYGSLLPLGGTLKVGYKSQIIEDRLGTQFGTQLVQDIVLQTGGNHLPLTSIPESDTPEAEQFFGGLSGATTRLFSADLASSGISSLLLSATAVTLPKDTTLNLGASGQLDINAEHIDLDARIRAAGGKVSLASYGKFAKDDQPATQGTIEIGPDAHIDLSGTRLDERGTASQAAVNVNGGSFFVNADHSATLAEGSVVDVSAGVWRSSGGSTSTGNAGSVKLSVNGVLDEQAEPTGQLFMNGDLRAFDFKSGGTLTLSGLHSLAIGGPAQDAWGMAVDQGLFADHGFGTFNLSALGNVDVLGSGQPVLRNYILTASRVALTPEALTSIGMVEAPNRQAINLNLAATLQPRKDLYGSLSVGGNVNVAQGVTVDVGAGGQIGLTAGGNIEVAGTLVAHGGNISLGLSGNRGGADIGGTKDATGFIEDQEIRLTSTGKLDVSGVALTTTTTSAGGELIRGRVLGGGSVKLNVKAGAPSRGRVVTEEKSVIDVSGVAADLDLGKSAGARTTLSKGAGSVSVASGDGFALMGTLKATRPDASVSGGQFSASISREGVADFTSNQEDAKQYKPEPHQLLLLNSVAEVANHARASNEGVLSSASLLNAGFDQIQLRADDKIVLGSGVDLVGHPQKGSDQVALRSVQLTSPVLQAQDNGSHLIQAAYVSLGDRDLKPQPALTVPVAPVVPAAEKGDARLSVQAGLIEVYGHSALQGFGNALNEKDHDSILLSATLDAAGHVGARRDGEIRFIGRTFSGYGDARKSDLKGSLNFGGEMTLQAGQVYASTLSNFVVQGLLGNSALTVAAPAGGSTSAAPLSALAQLSLQAQDVTIGGVIRQPFGSITINGEKKPTLIDGSVLSVSGDGVTVPVGTTINARQWLYATNGTVDGVDPAADNSVKVLDGLPVAKGILVKGQGLSIGNQTLVQAQAGGDLQAWEFIAGVGGSSDTLNTPNVFAILPTYHYDFAPFDTEIAASTKAVGTTLTAGDQVKISTASAVLAAGTYTLLPARYATLSGAVLVSASTLSLPVTLSQAIQRDDGSVLVSGYKTALGTDINGGNDLRQALVLEPEATFRAKSDLQISSVNAMLADKAKRAGTALPSRPGDAGRVSLAAKETFDWAAQFNLKGTDGFEAGQFDLAMPGMTLLATGESAGADAKTISVAQLNETGAQSILLGGTRTGTAENTRITTLAKDLTLSGAIEVGELIAVATDTLHVKAGTSVKSNAPESAAASTITVEGLGAALVVGNHAETDMSRDLSKVPVGTAPKGSLVVDSKVALEGAAIQLDGRQLVSLDADVTLLASSLGVGAPRIAVGGVSADENALSLTGALLTSANQAKRLQLRSYSSIDLLGSVALGGRDATVAKAPLLQSLILDAPELRGIGQATDTASVLAQNIVLRNNSGLQAKPADPSVSKLDITAEPPVKDGVNGGITVGKGAQNLAFASAKLNTAADVVFSGKGMLGAQGALTVSTGRVTADKTAHHGVNSQGLLTIEKAANSRAQFSQVGAGGSLSLTGSRVVQDGFIDLPSGSLSLTGLGETGQDDTVRFTERSITQAKGWTAQAGTTWGATAQGGQIKATAARGDVVVLGTLDVSAPLPSSASDTAKSAGAIALTATQGVLRLGDKALLKGSAATDTLSGSLTVDAGAVRNEAVAQAQAQTQAASVANAAAAEGTLDRLIDFANAGGLHGAVDVRVRQGDASLNTTLKAVRASLSADAGKLTLLGSAIIDARAPQGGLVQLASAKDLTVSAGAQILADSSRAGANGGDILLASASGQVKLEEDALITASGDDALDGRVVISMQRDALDSLVKEQAGKDADSIKTASITAGEVDVVGNRVYQGETVGEGRSGSVSTKTTTSTSTKTVTDVTDTETITTKTVTTKVKVDASFKDPKTGKTVVKAGDTDTAVAVEVSKKATPAGATLGSTSKTDTTTPNVQTSQVGRYVGLADVSDDAETFMNNGSDVLSAMGLTGRANLRAGVEIQSSGDFYLNNDLSLADKLHPGGQPVFLTVRADKNLSFRGSLSDGFASAARNAPINVGEGASYRLVAGADRSAANALKTSAAATGNLTIAANKVVRTTSGSIEMAAAQDIVLRTDESNKTTPVQGVAYVAGRAEVDESSGGATNFTSHGGRFEATAGRDIVAPGVSQLFGAWFNHVGFSDTESGQNVPVAWWSTFSAFKQGFGSFGGGNISAVAGRDISNLGVVAPTSAHVVTASERDALVVENGGDVTIQAGRDIRGGSFFIGQGNGLVQAGGAIAIGDSLDTTKLSPVGVMLGQMNGNWSMQAVRDVNLALAFNPTIFTNTNRSSAIGGLYFTYGDDSTLAMSSVAGDVNWLAASRANKGTASNGGFLSEIGKLGASDEQLTTGPGYRNAATGFAAPVVHIAALQGNVLVDLPADAIILAPSAKGDLSVYAYQDVSLRSLGPAFLSLGDGLFSDSYTLLNPRNETVAIKGGTIETGKLKTHVVVGPSQGNRVMASLLHAQDATPVRIYAGRDLVVESGALSGRAELTASKPAEIVAGRDIRNLYFIGQNFAETDVTRIAAGRDFVGASNSGGGRTGGLIRLHGPGELQVEAGGQLDLNTSVGIETTGNQFNTALSDQGASIRLAAGMARSVDVAEFADAYLTQDTAAQAKLVRYVKATLMLGDDALGDYPATGGPDQAQVYAKALAFYQTMTPQHQLALADELVTDAFVATYLSGQGAYAAAWQAQAAKAKVPVADRTTAAFKRFKDEVVMAEVRRLAAQAIDIADSTDAAENAKRNAQRQALWDQIDQMRNLAGLGKGFDASGDIDLAGSMAYTRGQGSLASGGIDLFAPGGQVIVGFSTLTANDKLQAATRGLVTMQGGSIRSVSDGDFQVNSQKAFVVGEGDVLVYSAHGSIDSGRGSNTDVTVPAPVVSVDESGIVTRTVPAATTGSGIGRLNAGDVKSAGNVLLAAPNGEIRALDAFIRNESGGDIAVAGRVLGGDNIKGNVSGLAPAPTVNVSLNVNSALPTDAGVSAQTAVDGVQGKRDKDPASILTVDVLGVGDEATAPAAGPVAVPVDASSISPGKKPCRKEDCKR
ncbi:filamentous haemagglutinin family protein [Aquabacterium sp.]|uniref:two-partner secretion domain-containing protein n=1 Tax=Aquabacterium sp. TaxID=1872578 RepID=UPI0019B1220B|nr:filamentous haemagglutinin family protein [Aquabacterium sp.]MBC7702020.1 filamentous hemagglutinin family protein [Aquabacterium sp.]